MPTPEELANMDYGGDNAFARGILASDYLQHLYDPHGKVIRWWAAYEADPETTVRGPGGETVQKNGRIYVERTTALNGAALNTVKAYPYRTTRNILDPEWGVIEKSATGVSVVPSQIEFARYDRLSFVGVNWLARGIIERGAGEIDVLVRQPVAAITEILKLTAGANAAAVNDALYTATDTGIQWDDDDIEEGTPLSVVYRFSPVWEWLCTDDQGVMQQGPDGEFLPQRGVVQLVANIG